MSREGGQPGVLDLTLGYSGEFLTPFLHMFPHAAPCTGLQSHSAGSGTAGSTSGGTDLQSSLAKAPG